MSANPADNRIGVGTPYRQSLRRRVNRARQGLKNHCVTCPASRHLHIMANRLMTPKRDGSLRYPMFQEEPEHCAESIYAVLACLWEARRYLRWSTKRGRWELKR